VVALTDGAYRRILRANVDGVVFGVREVAARLMPDGGSIVVTASLAGLTAVPSDPVYALTKHAVVGFVRSVAPQLAERGIRINAVCPGFADTPLLSEEFRTSLGDLPLLSAEEVADAIVMALRSGETGQAWPVQPGRKPEPYRFRGVPGPRGGERA
jgi:NAD(P)-dependent dehydrogenase (short-subunit alcohol dehydrogenase family)